MNLSPMYLYIGVGYVCCSWV